MVHKIDFVRIIRAGTFSFQRNAWLSTASIIMMTLVLLVIGGLSFLGAMSQVIFANFSDKIDVSVYVRSGTPENKIFGVREELSKLPEVKNVVYVSQDEALARFKDAHKDNALILDSLQELSKNPLEASLNIKAKEAGQFSKISEYLSAKNYEFIDKINFFENKRMIERLSTLAAAIRYGGIFIALLFAAIAMIIVFNTIRIAIYAKREEIHIMKLVGASHWYIRGPFIVEGVLHGVISALLSLLLLFPAAWIASPKVSVLISGFDLLGYYRENVAILFALLLCIGVVLGISSSMIAMRRYLKEV